MAGIELGANYRVTDILISYAGANLTDSEIKENSSRPDNVGNESPHTSEYTANIGAEMRWALSDGRSFFARVDAQIIGDTWFHTVQEGQSPAIFVPLFEQGFGAGACAFGIADFSNARRDSD